SAICCGDASGRSTDTFRVAPRCASLVKSKRASATPGMALIARSSWSARTSRSVVPHALRSQVSNRATTASTVERRDDLVRRCPVALCREAREVRGRGLTDMVGTLRDIYCIVLRIKVQQVVAL